MIAYQFHPDALEEADAAAAFYKNKQQGLEKRFLAALEDSILRVRKNPLIYRKVETDGDVRK